MVTSISRKVRLRKMMSERTCSRDYKRTRLKMEVCGGRVHTPSICPNHLISAKPSYQPAPPTSSQLFLSLSHLQYAATTLHHLAPQYISDRSFLPCRPIPQHVCLNCLGALSIGCKLRVSDTTTTRKRNVHESEHLCSGTYHVLVNYPHYLPPYALETESMLILNVPGSRNPSPSPRAAGAPTS